MRDAKRQPEDMRGTIDRLKAMADRAGNSLYLSDGPVHPDHALLGMCAEVLELVQRQTTMRKRSLAVPIVTSADRQRFRDEVDERQRLRARTRQLLRQAGKLSASTPAGIFAKAQMVRVSDSAAPVLGLSLAVDLINSSAIRQSIWAPANAEYAKVETAAPASPAPDAAGRPA